MNRREFLGWVGVGSLASSLPIAIAACSEPTDSQVSQPAPQPGTFRAIGTVADLDRTGQLFDKQVANAPVLVIRNPGNPKQLLAVNPTCTHRGCIVDWKASSKTLVCPCHRAEFAPDGKVLKAPAKEPLPSYSVKVEQGKVLVAAKGPVKTSSNLQALEQEKGES